MISALIIIGCVSAAVSVGALVYAGVHALQEEMGAHRQRQERHRAGQ